MTTIIVVSLLTLVAVASGGALFLAGAAYLSWQLSLRTPPREELIGAVRDAIEESFDEAATYDLDVEDEE